MPEGLHQSVYYLLTVEVEWNERELVNGAAIGKNGGIQRPQQQPRQPE